MYNCIVIIIDELWLKGKNRHLYFRKLNNNIRVVVKLYHENKFSCKTVNQRFLLESDVPFNEELIAALVKIPGINSMLPSIKTELDFDSISKVALKILEDINTRNIRFKVKTKRSNKNFPITSVELSGNLGEVILEHHPDLKVDLVNPELIVDVRILDSDAFVSTTKIGGVGGFPVGVHGKVLTLLSGGFDSPVASYLMARRGCDQDYIFFYAYPYVGDEVREKIIKIVECLAPFQPLSRLYIFPFGKIQDKIAEVCRPEYRTLLFRKYMIKAANLFADKLKCEALITGDSLGQVSSQTLYNITALDSSSKRSIFRPLLGYTKREIIDLSKEIGTHDVSQIPHDDACSMFAPKHPILKPDRLYLEKVDYMADFDSMVELQAKEVEMLEFLPNGKIVD